MPRGGSRTGAVGRAYPNRQDLRTPKPIAPTAALDQTYGVAGAQLAAQRAIPLRRPTTPGVGLGVGVGVAGPVPSAPAPGVSLPFDRDTERPDEPVTTGVPVGPGAGPEVLAEMPMQEREQDIAALAPYLPVLELLASQPNSTASTRNFVRRLRGGMPAL